MNMPNAIIIERVEIQLDTKIAARWFANLSDNEMGDFLINVAEEAKKYSSSPDTQWHYLGRYLRNCEFSTDEARDMIKSWAYWIEHSMHR